MLTYIIQIISEAAQIVDCPVFYMDSFNWGGDYRPVSYGQMAFLKEEGFLLHMVCEEEHPHCTYVFDNDPVYLDSAMEAFLAFDSGTDYYFNFEFNSCAALLTQYGNSKKDRIPLKEEEQNLIQRKSCQKDKTWCVDLLIPLSLISLYFPTISIRENSHIRLNFYKLAEGDTDTHFASYAPIQSPTPNFHLPEFFADAIIKY